MSCTLSGICARLGSGQKLMCLTHDPQEVNLCLLPRLGSGLGSGLGSAVSHVKNLCLLPTLLQVHSL